MQLNLTKKILIILVSFCSFGVHPGPKGHLEKEWQDLLYYQKNWRGHYKSLVQTPDYFLAPNGRTDPKAEFNHTLTSFKNSQNQCRFIGRYTWFQQNFSHLKLPPVHCPDFEVWTGGNEVDSISLVFATGYLGNPASFFGHPFFKLNWKRNQRNYLLDRSVNYGAIVPEDTGGMMYLIKGLFGGFEASYSSSDFYYINHSYGENELRDLWEYQLNFTDQQKELFLAHLFEHQRIKFPYLFATKNCGYNVGLLLENITKKKILNPYGIIEQPITIVENLEDNNLITEFKLIPSRQTRFSEKYNVLNARQKKEFLSFLDKNKLSFDFNKLSANEQKEILDALIEYIEFVKLKTGETSFSKIEVLNKRLHLDKEKTQDKINAEKIAPHLKQKSSFVSIGVLSSKEIDEHLIIRSSAAYYNWLSPYYEMNETGELSILDFSFLYKSKKVTPQEFTILRIKNLNTSQTGLKHDGGMLWNLELGLDNNGLNTKNYRNFGLKGGVGKTYNFKNLILTYLHSNMRVNVKNDSYGIGYAELGGGLVFELSKSIKLNIEYNNRFFENKERYDFISLKARILERRDFDFKISYTKLINTEINGTINLYW